MSVSTKQSRWGEPMRHSLSELEAFDAMRVFLEAFWRRGGCKSDELAMLLGSTNRGGYPDGSKQLPHLVGAPLDIAQWNDWLDAIAVIKSE